MLVEALFWFYPMVWLIGARLIVERERACDESVLARGHDREVYAGGILKVCKFCLQSPLPQAINQVSRSVAAAADQALTRGMSAMVMQLGAHGSGAAAPAH